MTDRTKQRIEDLRKVFIQETPEINESEISYEWFKDHLKCDKEMMFFIKNTPDDIWTIFMDTRPNKENKATPKKEKVVEFDWDCLPKWCNEYIAMDKDKNWYTYSGLPKASEHWFSSTSNSALSLHIPSDYNPKNFTGDWKDSLMKNPNKH